MTGELDVLHLVNALEFDHLAQSLELLQTSKAAHRETDEAWPDTKAHRYALSAIMHAFAAFEGQVNRIAYSVLREPHSPLYVSPQKRSYEFKDMVRRWDGGLAIDKKTEFLLGLRHATHPPNILPQLRELVLLRNWIIHGKVYRTELLIEREADVPHSGTVRLRVDGDEWTPRFPQFKFPMPDRLSYPDARAFFLGVCSIMHHVGRSCGFGPVLLLRQGTPVSVVVLGGDEDPMVKIAAHLDTPTNAAT